MSITTDARTYADSAVAQGKSALAHAGTALGQAGIALGAINRRLIADAPKPVYAAIGAADLVAASVAKRAEELPTDAAHGVGKAQQGVGKAQQTGQTLIIRAQADANTRLAELRERLASSRQAMNTLPDTARTVRENYLTAAKSASEAYLQAAKGIYATLTDRGEARAAELRNNPRLAKLLGQVGETAAGVRDTVTPVAKSAFDAVTEPTDTEPTVAELTGKPAPARKPAASKTSASKPAASKATPASKPAASKPVGAKKTATRKSGATKA